MSKLQYISPQMLANLHQQQPGLQVIDVRTPAEYRAVHTDFAQLVPLDRLEPALLDTERPVYIFCRSGARAKSACERILRHAPAETYIVEGGMLAWEAAGLPVVRGKSMMSIERQARVLQGALVALGTALGVTLSPWFLVLPGFVGCGMVYAGLTDSCAMGMMLARMPWNQAGGGPANPGASCSA